jgi:hypothetical protein
MCMKINRQRGIVRTIIIVVIALLVISYYGINIQQVANSPTAQSNFSYVWNGVTYVWNTFLKVPAEEGYNFFITYIWTPSLNDIQRIDNNQLPSSEQKINNNPNLYPTPPATR